MEFFNVYVELTASDNYYINVISTEQVSILVDAYLKGEVSVTIKGVVRNINNPSKFLIYSMTELESLGKEQHEIERNLIKAKSILNGGKMSQSLYSQFGTNVTDRFTKCKGWGSSKKLNTNRSNPINNPSNMGKIFISHSTKNKDVVNKFCDLVLDNGLNIDLSKEIFNTSLDGSKPQSGEDFRDRIKSELIDAKLVLQFISKEYRDSHVCMNEMGAAWVLSGNVIPLIIEKNEYEVGFIHSTNQQCQLSSKNSILNLIDTLRDRGIVKDYKLSRLASKVEEFVTWLESYSTPRKETPIRVEKTPEHNIKDSRVFKVQNRSGLYLRNSLNENIYHLFPDEISIKLTGFSDTNVLEIPPRDFEKMTKGQILQSVHNAKLIKEAISNKFWILLNNRRHAIPDLSTVKYLIEKCSCKTPVVMQLNDLEKIEQRNDLISINKVLPKHKKVGWGN